MEERVQKYPINSSNITGIEFDPQTHTLWIMFRGGSTYRFADVPHETVLRLTVAESAGQFFHKHIKGKFTTSRVK